MPEPKTPKPPFWTSILFLVIAAVPVLMLLMVLFVTQAIPPPAMSYVAIGIIVALWTLAYFQFKEKKKYLPPPELSDPARIRKSILKLRIASIIFAALLINGYFASRHDPLLLRIVGATIDIAFIALLLHTVRKLQHKLKE